MSRGGRLPVSREGPEPRRSRWRWWLSGAALLVLVMLGPQLIEGTGSACGALAVRNSVQTAGRDSLGRMLAIGAARAVGGEVIEAELDARGRSVVPASVSCAVVCWKDLIRP